MGQAGIADCQMRHAVRWRFAVCGVGIRRGVGRGKRDLRGREVLAGRAWTHNDTDGCACLRAPAIARPSPPRARAAATPHLFENAPNRDRHLPAEMP